MFEWTFNHSTDCTCNVHVCINKSTSSLIQVLKLEDEKRALKQALERHRIEADQAHKYYVDTGKKCAAEWAEIRDLERSTSLTDEEEERLAVLKNKFTVTIAADYLMSKLVPYWGLSPQPGSTSYMYLQKLRLGPTGSFLRSRTPLVPMATFNNTILHVL